MEVCAWPLDKATTKTPRHQGSPRILIMFRSLKEILELASEENIILRTQDGREFVLAEIDDFDREVELTRQNEEFMQFLDERSR